MTTDYNEDEELKRFLEEWHSADNCVTVHTSGSTGKPKSMRVEKRRMEASARKTCDFLGLSSDDSALLCMPLQYIAGKMMVVRSVVAGMKLINVKPSSHPLSSLQSIPSFAAMVPLQVANSLENAAEREKLRSIKNLIIGGGAIDERLALELRDFPNAVWSTYGMTETLSHIAMRRLNGTDADDFYSPLPGVKVWLNASTCLCIEAPQIVEGCLETNDVAEFDSSGSRFRIKGRIDNVINSGGIKIQAEEVERIVSPLSPFPIAATSEADPKLGEALVIVLQCNPWQDGFWEKFSLLKEKINVVLPKYWKPRHYLFFRSIPLTGNGKIARAELKKMIDH